MLRLVRINRLAQKFLAASAIHICEGYDGETGVLHQLHLCQLGWPLQMITDQIKGEELKEPFPGLVCVQLSGAAGRQVPGMRVGILQIGIDQIEVLPRNDAFTSDLNGVPNGYGERDVQVSTDRMGHILSNGTFPATGDGLLQLAVFIAQHNGQTIQFPRNQNRAASGKAYQFFDRLGFLGGEHGLGMPDGCQFLQNFAGYLLSRRSGDHQTRFGLQLQKFIRELVILPVAHDRIIIPVVGNICFGQGFNQILHAKDLVFIHTHRCVPPFLK